MEDRMSLGKLIADRRKAMRMTQEELAEKMHVSKSAVAKWETNGGVPDRFNLKMLSSIINVSLDDLYRIISNTDYESTDMEVNITAEVITLLESYGYKVLRPDEGGENNYTED